MDESNLESQQTNRGGFIRTLVLIIVVLVIAYALGFDLSTIWGYVVTILKLVWQIVSLVLSFFIETLKAAIDALRKLLDMTQS